MTMDVDIIKDLTDRTPHKPRRFRIDPDLFECAAKLPAGVVQDIGELRRKVLAAQAAQAAGQDVDENVVEQMNRTFFGLLDVILLPESSIRFAARMRDPEHPIDMDDINNFIVWVVQEYGGRPTTPSSDSATLPTPTGTNSMDGAPPEPSTPLTSVSTGL